MKIQEILNNDYVNVKDVMASLGISASNYKQNADGTFDVEYDKVIIKNEHLVNSELPIKFRCVNSNFDAAADKLLNFNGFPRTVHGNFIISGNDNIKSLIGCPTYVGGVVGIADYNNVKTLEGLPRHLGSFANIYGKMIKIESLEGIADNIDFIDAWISVPWQTVIRGGLGLVLIRGSFELYGLTDAVKRGPFGIISKYLGRPDDIFDCQYELINAGYEAYAVL